MTHIIQKQVLEFTLDEGPNRVALHDDLVRSFKESTVAALSSLFDKMAPEHLIYKIDRLEVDLGQIAPADFEKELLRQVEKLLQTQLVNQPEVSKESLKAISKEQSILQQFLHFLSKGYFSWNANGISLAQMELELPHIFKNLTSEDQKDLLIALSNRPSLKRLKAQFTIQFHSNLVAALLPFEDFKIWETLFRKVLPKSGLQEVSITALSIYAANPNISEVQFISELFTSLTDSSRITGKEVMKLQRAFLAKAKELIPAQAKKVIEAFNSDESNEMAELKISEESFRESEQTEHKNANVIYINNAGVVLLWPYLQRFFGNIKLTDGNGFKDRQSTEMAVRTLHHLVSPKEPLSENLFPLNKILCGLDVNDLVPTLDDNGKSFAIPDKDIEAGKELIEAVIENWGTIGSTSVEGFQNSFLQREGKLENDEQGWKLKVEQRPFDVLMNSLPWNINLIKLPWMPKPLHVEW